MAASLLNNPTFTAFVGGILVFLGGCIRQIIDWRKDVSIVREKSRIEYLKNAVEELKKFLEKAVVNVADLNEPHELHAVRVRNFYKQSLAANPSRINKERQETLDNYHHMIVAYMTIRHLLSSKDRDFLDALHKNILTYMEVENKSSDDYIGIISEFRAFSGCLYVSLIKNLEKISDHLGYN